jgi:hypothetical protein
MKKITLMMALVLAMTLGLASKSFAKVNPTCPEGRFFCAFNIVDNTPGATTWSGPVTADSYQDPILSLSQTPVLYFKLSLPTDKIDGMWIREGNSPFEPFGDVSPSNVVTGEGWISPAMWASLPTSSKIGSWSVLGHIKGTNSWSIDSNGDLDCPTCAIANFVVTPEPMSMVLYGMGGLPLAAHFLRRRKVAA